MSDPRFDVAGAKLTMVVQGELFLSGQTYGLMSSLCYSLGVVWVIADGEGGDKEGSIVRWSPCLSQKFDVDAGIEAATKNGSRQALGDEHP